MYLEMVLVTLTKVFTLFREVLLALTTVSTVEMP